MGKNKTKGPIIGAELIEELNGVVMPTYDDLQASKRNTRGMRMVLGYETLLAAYRDQQLQIEGFKKLCN